MNDGAYEWTMGSAHGTFRPKHRADVGTKIGETPLADALYSLARDVRDHIAISSGQLEALAVKVELLERGIPS